MLWERLTSSRDCPSCGADVTAALRPQPFLTVVGINCIMSAFALLENGPQVEEQGSKLGSRVDSNENDQPHQGMSV